MMLQEIFVAVVSWRCELCGARGVARGTVLTDAAVFIAAAEEQHATKKPECPGALRFPSQWYVVPSPKTRATSSGLDDSSPGESESSDVPDLGRS